MFMKSTREDDDVVDIDFREVSAVCQEVVHYALECSRGVAEAKWHYAKLEASKLGLKSSPRDMFGFYANLMIALLEIDFG